MASKKARRAASIRTKIRRYGPDHYDAYGTTFKRCDGVWSATKDGETIAYPGIKLVEVVRKYKPRVKRAIYLES